MWSRLTEYAGSVAEIVAPADSDGEHGDDVEGGERPPRSSGAPGDELWSRLTSIVAPSSSSDSAPHAGDAGGDDEDEDEQERYISELERALLQKKRQNERLEERIRELEAAATTSTTAQPVATSIPVSTLAPEENADTSETLPPIVEGSSKATPPEWAEIRESTAGAVREASETWEKTCRDQEQLLEQLECRLVDLSTQFKILQATRTVPTSADNGADDTAMSSIFPTLVQAVLVLSTGSSTSGMEVGTTLEAVAQQLVVLAERVRDDYERVQSIATKSTTTLTSFLSMHGVTVNPESPAFHAEVQAKLGTLSHQLSKGQADAEEVRRLGEVLAETTQREEKSAKTILALQTQLSGVQASKTRNDQTVASREAELVAAMQKKDALIVKFQENEERFKHVMTEMENELETAHREIEELEKASRSREREMASFIATKQELATLQNAHRELQTRCQELQESAQEFEQGYLQLLEEAERVKSETEAEKAVLVATTETQIRSLENQSLYELEARLTASEADKRVAIQDAERLQDELDALEKVLLQFRMDQKHQRERLAETERALEECRAQVSESKQSVDSVSEEDFKRVMEVLSKRTQECEQLREALESAAKRYGADGDVLDKRLAAQLMVSYLESEKKDEVLLLISRMMGFSEEQKRRAGIWSDGHVVIPGNGGGGLFSSLFGLSGATHEDSNGRQDPHGEAHADPDKPLGDAWTKFLLDEAKK